MLKIEDDDATEGGAASAALTDNDKNQRKIARKFSDRVYDYYMDMWKLFYASYLVLPIVL